MKGSRTPHLPPGRTALRSTEPPAGQAWGLGMASWRLPVGQPRVGGSGPPLAPSCAVTLRPPALGVTTRPGWLGLAHQQRLPKVGNTRRVTMVSSSGKKVWESHVLGEMSVFKALDHLSPSQP